MTATRIWSAVCRYQDRKPFRFGNVQMPTEAKDHDVVAALIAAWAEVSPYPAPDMVAVPGMVIFVPGALS